MVTRLLFLFALMRPSGEVHGFSLTTCPSRPAIARALLTTNGGNAMDNVLSNRIRWRSRHYFKPDESVDLYGGDEEKEEDDDDDDSLADKDEPDVQWMATFVVNRLARAYIRNKMKRMRDQQSKAAEQEVVVQEDKTESPPDANVVEEVVAVAEIAETPVEADVTKEEEITTASKGGDETVEETVVEETVEPHVEGEDVSGETAAYSVENLEEGSSTENVVAASDESDNKVSVETTNEEEKDEAVVLTAELPSLMHEKEGDRNIRLRDDLVEAKPSNVGDGDIWGRIPVIPQEISLEFGRPLQVVQEGVPPIRS